MAFSHDAKSYMQLAIRLAESVQGQTGINPAVGCVIVKQGRIVGMGAHLERGKEHAEIHALQMAGEQAQGSTVYVTLEPCSHHGRTPPCADQLVQAGVAKVVVATQDPNPEVAGNGVNKLQKHGIEVEIGLLDEVARKLNIPFNKFIRTRLPYVTMKTASTLDGKIASRTGDSRWITNEASRAYVHTLRHQHQAIMVGVNTVIADDPQLTVRLEGGGNHPIRIVADSSLRIPHHARMLHDRLAPVLILTTEKASTQSVSELEALGAEVIVCGSSAKVDLRLAMSELGEREIGSILLEGGGVLNGAMLSEKLIDKLVLFFGPKIIGGDAPGIFKFAGYEQMADAVTLRDIVTKQFEDDLCIEGQLVYEQEGGSSHVHRHC